MLYGLSVVSSSLLIASWKCIMEGRVTGTGCKKSLYSLDVPSGWYCCCEYGGYTMSSGAGYAEYAKRGGVLDPSLLKFCAKIISLSSMGGVYWLGNIRGDDCLWDALEDFLSCWDSERLVWSSACVDGGEAEEDPALRSRSSRRLLSFLPWRTSVMSQEAMVWGTHGSFSEQCGFVSFFVLLDLRSLSSLHPGLQNYWKHY